MFPRNMWYVAATPAELTRKPLSRRILGERLALFRTESGQAVALEDKCPHRMLPLSRGKVIGERVQCAYHGAEFSPDGKCVSVPGQADLPANVHVRAYPVCERFGMVWIWMGSPEGSGEQAPCSIFEFIEKEVWDSIDGYIHISCDYQLINDNLADTTHVPFVHPTTLGIRDVSRTRSLQEQPQGGTKISLSHEIQDLGMSMRMRLLDTRLSPTFENAFIRLRGAREGQSLDFQLDYIFHSPVFWIFRPTTREANAAEATGLSTDSMIMITPETEHSSHYFYKTCQKYAPGSRSETDYWHEQTTQAFIEDKHVLEAQQENIGACDLHDYSLVSFRSDTIGFHVRRLVRKLAHAE